MLIVRAAARIFCSSFHGYRNTYQLQITGQTHDLTNLGKDLKAEAIAEARPEAFFPNTDFGRFLLEAVEGKLAQKRKVMGTVASADATLVLVECHINHPVAAILNRPLGAGRVTARVPN